MASAVAEAEETGDERRGARAGERGGVDLCDGQHVSMAMGEQPASQPASHASSMQAAQRTANESTHVCDGPISRRSGGEAEREKSAFELSHDSTRWTNERESSDNINFHTNLKRTVKT